MKCHISTIKTSLAIYVEFAEYLKASIYNADEIKSANEIAVNKVDYGCYENYKYNFLTTP